MAFGMEAIFEILESRKEISDSRSVSTYTSQQEEGEYPGAVSLQIRQSGEVWVLTTFAQLASGPC